MSLSLSSLLVVVVVVVCGTPTGAAPRSAYDVSSGVRSFPWLTGYPRPYYPASGLYPSTDDYLGTRGDYPDSSMRGSIIEDFNRRVFEAQRRYYDDLLMLRRQLEDQGYPLRTPAPDMPWYFPAFPYPYVPQDMVSEEKEEQMKDKKKKKPVKDEESDEGVYSDGDYEEADAGDVVASVLSSDGGDLESLFLDAPTPGEEWKVIPLLPEVPDADDLPDQYDNSTHTVHVINGSRVEVNTTTHKDSGDIVTTFFHTEVINILPEETVPEETVPEEDTTENSVPEGEEGVTEETEGADGETHAEEGTLVIPSDLEELIKEVDSKGKTNAGRIINTISSNKNNSDTRYAREATEDLATTPSPTPSGPKTQHLAAYVKGGPATKGAGKGKGDAAPTRDLSGDTLVNVLDGKKGGKEIEPDAEIISSEELL